MALTPYHQERFDRAGRYYAALEAGGKPRYRRRSPRWLLMASAFVAGATLAFTAASILLPATAAALPEKLALTPRHHVTAIAPSRLAAQAASFRQKAAWAAAHRPRPRPKPVQVIAAATQPAAVPSAGYANPLRAIIGLVPERIDAGVDFGGTGPVYALGPGIIQASYCHCSGGGWPGGGWICEYLTGGPDAGSSVYVAEDVTATVSEGERVYDTTQIATMWGGIETGWAQGGCMGNALDGYYGYPTPAGNSYDGVLMSLGVPPPFSSTGAGPLDTGKPGGTASGRHPCGWRCYPRNRAMAWALTQKGCWYTYGGTSCAQGFDCSGLVTMAYRHAGFDLPRTTYEILGDVGVRHYRRHTWWVLVEVWHPKRGDLAFYGSGHVELDTRLHDTTFGAHDSGTQVSYAHWGYGWAPTAFYRIEVHRRH